MFIWYSTVFALMMIIAIYIILKGRNHRNKYTVLESRDALLSPEELERHAAEIAKKHNISKNNGFSDCLITRMNRNFNLIASVYKMLNKDVKMGIPVSPAAEWLLDNFYIVEEQVKGIRNDLVREKCLQLNILNSGFLKGYPRVYAIALELVSHLDGRLDKSIILNFIKIYQSQNILSMGELWAMPMMLKIALIENMTNLCEKIGQTQIQIKNVRNFSHMDLSAIDNLIKENLKIIDRGSFSFIEQLLKKLRQAGRETKEILNHLDKKLFEFDLTADKIIQEEHQEQASRQVAMGNSVTSLKMMASLNWNKLFEELSVVEGILREDPDGSYPRMDFESRNYYRNQIEKMAQQLKTSEINVARKALKLALEAGSAQTKFRHVGYYLVGLGKNKLIQELGGRGNQRAGSMNRYLGPVCIITSLIIVLCIVYAIYAAPESKASVLILVALVALIPASDIAVTIVNRIITSRTEPTFLPKIAYNEGIPKEAATLVVVPTLLPHTQRVQELIRQLEVHYLGNREDNIYFALLGDFKDADRQQLPGDEEIMLTARKAIEELNKKYAGDKDVFFFFSRNRTFSQQQNCWMGWERKRGALLELNNLLENPEKKGSFNIVGDISVLNQIKYVITLDADTRLPLHGAKKLIGTISHPLNKAVFDHKKGIVVEGYGLIQPRINVSIESANKTLFTRIFAGQGGIDPYTTAISDVYQDYFGEGIFTGKGIYDLEVFQKTLKDAIPENTILSHDLLEGSYVRVGLATDLELVDGYPAKYNSYMMRLHRWVRGDWQLIHWLSSFIKNQKGDRIPNPISSLSRWKILDNLRRSLVSFSVMLLFILGSTIFPGHSLFWLGFGLITIGFPFILECSDFVLRKHYRTEWDKRHSNIIFGLKGVFYQVFLVLVFLPYQAYMMTDAIIRSLYRMIVTRKNLLQWVTAADVEKKIKSNLFSFIRQMAPAVFGAIAIFLLVFFMRRESLFYLFPLLILWCVSPLAAYYISRDNVDKKDALSQNDINELRKLARKTWAYYEDFAGAKDNFLPPDNFQENPPNGVAHRTSPTNIGFLFMAILAARDFGFICTTQLSEMVERTLTTVEKMDKWKGHLYNWYHTLTLKVLKPAFVSTVDSGNFVGYLMTLKQGLREYLKRPLVDRYLLQGMKSTLELAGKEYPQAFKSIEDLLGKNQIGLYDWCCFLDTISLEKPVKSNWLQRFERMLESYQREMQSLFLPLNFFQELPEILDEAERYRIVLELVQSLQENCSIGDLKEIYAKLIKEAEKALLNSTGEEQKKILSQLIIEIKRVKKNVVLICDRFEDLIFRLEKLIEGTCFAPLYDEQKRLFSIGYHVEEEKLVNSYYDLLASEARITSFLAVARGEVPEEHWSRLGRSLTLVDGYKGLVSWAGTMFEYFMPVLIMENFPNTLLDETYRFVVRTQQKYGEKRGVPWGTSESGFYSFDVQLNYQYKAFGVPDLGLKRGLINDMVVSPYSTLLALPFSPSAAMENIKRLQVDGIEGDYGFYEAVDYTPERLFMGRKKGIVQSYMAHHQGMSLVALDNFFYDGLMQRRFHQDPLVKAAELLLQEKVPLRVIITKENKEIVEPFEVVEREQPPVIRKFGVPGEAGGSCHLLSNGRYSVMVTQGGSGYSKLEGIQVNRWRENFTSDPWGFYVFLRNVSTGGVWSVTYEPFLKKPDKYEVIYSPHKAEFIRLDNEIGTHTEITVSPESNAEIRKISIANHGETPVVIEATSYFEVVLASHNADIAHPVFSNLFVRTEFVEKWGSILASRKPRELDQPEVWAVHNLQVDGETKGNLQYETDRGKFIGRCRNITDAEALDLDQPLSNTTGAVLDPIMSLRRMIKIDPGKVAQITYMIGIAQDRGEALQLAEKFQESSFVKRSFELSCTRSQVEEGYLNLKPDEIKTYQDMVTHIIFLSPLKKRYHHILHQNTKGQAGLWAYGVSGDLPLILVLLKNFTHLDLVSDVLKAHEYWKLKGLNVDLVIMYQDEEGYLQPLHEAITDMVMVSHARDIVNQPGGVFLIKEKAIPPEDVILFYTVARIVLKGEKGSIAAQLKSEEETELVSPPKKFDSVKANYISRDTPLELLFSNGYGGFDLNGKEYVIRLKEDMNTPAPWINVMSNTRFGTLISESGSGFTWAENSRENKLTPWSNDPVSDPPGEIIYLRDEETGEFWSLTPLPIREKESYTIRHGLGYSSFHHDSHGIDQELTVFVPQEDPVKVSLVKITNREKEKRKLTLTYFVKPVLGVAEQVTRQYICTERIGDNGPIIMKNSYNLDFPGRVAFVASSEEVVCYTGDAKEFLGGGSLKAPGALKREGLLNQLGAGFDPCAAIQVSVELIAGAEKELAFILGQGKDLEEAVHFTNLYKDLSHCRKAFDHVKQFWHQKLNLFQIKTPDLSLDILVNNWLLYQVLSCRVWGRSAFYQSGGAFGFRDQLQDVLSLVYTAPEITREQILLHCGHQFIEGDVQHWWHPGAGDKGVRTRFSDDLLWLPFVTAEYVSITGDYQILEEEVSYLEDDLLKENEQERYGIPKVSQEKSSVYEHCLRAIERSLKFGSHGIPLMGSGDWNDGMSCVGYLGKGESVWLGWFLCKILKDFLPLCNYMKDEERGKRYLKLVQEIAENIEKNAWDGSWYRRAYFDDGTPLGSMENTECQIDSLAQSWAVISGIGRADRVKDAMGAVEKHLVRKEEGLILLFTPPFGEGDLQPGYIKGYVPGVRENGGQYTHAATWVISAFAQLGYGDKAWALYNMINPINHSRTPIESATYKVEPYVMAADVYAVAPHIGRGGWTWYTGAASWMYKVGVENILGFVKKGEILYFNPCIPKEWPEYFIRYTYQNTLYQIHIKNPSGINRGVQRVIIDGKEVAEKKITLVNDHREHQIEVIMG